MTELVLHHYDRSPYAEKARAMLGFKGAEWFSVKQPSIMPKPDLVALTGGYRRIPVLQIGADVFCDTGLIALELERAQPTPALFPPDLPPLAPFLSDWVDNYLFWQVAPFVTGCWADDLPDAFIEDRAAMTGGRGMTRERMKAALPHQLAQIRAVLPWVVEVLAASEYVAGTEPSYHDFALYHCLWFLGATDPGRALLAEERFQPLQRWVARIGAHGHGHPAPMVADAALEVARTAEPRPVEPFTDDPSGLQPGATVSVKPERFGTERVTGELRRVDAAGIVLAVDTERAGRVHVHLPRQGQVLMPA
ncbi:glutathione S-transferase family protein [Ectothiorhodospiraceae bacterium WFHF3C12]|nr:glutathione S-transferase family protein [Ectothiorhodospiraceae bacterium WFHF3C12]